MANNKKTTSNNENVSDVIVNESVDSNESTNENVSNDTSEKPNTKKSGKVKGSVDSNYELDENEKGLFHIRHSRIETMPSGVQVEDPGSVRIQKYGVKFIEDQIINKEKEPPLPSIWDMGETVKILHDPTK